MKNILFVFLFLSTAIFAQQNDKKWDKIIALETEGKIRSANEIVVDIYKNAKAKKDEEQIIKCFFYQSKYMQILEEDAQTKIINNLKLTISQISVPSKAILKIVYAKCLNDYFNKNNYQIRSRTNIETADADFLTWTEKNFKNQINEAMAETLQNENLLKNTPISIYEKIFDYSSSEKFKTENLYDYVLAENINFYTQKLSTWQIPKNIFIPYKKDFFGNSSAFTKLNLDFINDQNLHLVISLYQKKKEIIHHHKINSNVCFFAKIIYFRQMMII
ncbi:hypothetical protein ACQ9BO_26530 [Flavobacterium sp. P21]|uniref:hypothetical protein n=1 Tax=Flavobacterium sp. P21 TaxID=3423948 RepID=UPI003D67BB75